MSQFALRNLCVLVYANGFTGWHYKAGGSTIGDVLSQGFFADARDMLSAGDILLVSASDGIGQFGVSVKGNDVTLSHVVTDPAAYLAA